MLHHVMCGVKRISSRMSLKGIIQTRLSVCRYSFILRLTVAARMKRSRRTYEYIFHPNKRNIIREYLRNFRCNSISYFACVFVQTIYSTSSLNGFKNANADVLNHTQSRFLARNLYITDTTCPFNFNTGKQAIC